MSATIAAVEKQGAGMRRDSGEGSGIFRGVRMMTSERIEWHLWNWTNWMQQPSRQGTFSNRASGGLRGYTNFDIESEYEEADRVAAAAVQAILDGMTQRLRIAVYVQHGVMSAVYRVRDADAAYVEACSLLGAQLARRGLC